MTLAELIKLSAGEEVSMAPSESAAVAGWVRELAAGLGRPLVCAEIGTWCGWTAILMALSGARVLCVDPFTGADEQTHAAASRLGGATLERFIANAWMAGVGDRVVGVVGFSVEVAQMLPDEVFDLVFIDGDHSEVSVKADCLAWAPKVRPGGALGGHDAHQIQVGKAVHAAVAILGWPGLGYRDGHPLWLVMRPK